MVKPFGLRILMMAPVVLLPVAMIGAQQPAQQYGVQQQFGEEYVEEFRTPLPPGETVMIDRDWLAQQQWEQAQRMDDQMWPAQPQTRIMTEEEWIAFIGEPGAGEAARPAAPMTPDTQYKMEAARGNIFELRASEMALQRSTDQGVRQYAARVHRDHAQANRELREIGQATGVALPMNPPLGTAAMQAFDAQQQSMLQQLQGMTGQDFDRAFLNMQAAHHRRDIAEYQRIAADPNVSPELRAYALRSLPVLQEHLQMAEGLQQRLG